MFTAVEASSITQAAGQSVESPKYANGLIYLQLGMSKLGKTHLVFKAIEAASVTQARGYPVNHHSKSTGKCTCNLI
jgi:hypothetical protein